jgi:hypothetical protein
MASKRIWVYRGDDIPTIKITIMDIDGNPIDITDYTLFFTVKEIVNETATGSLDSTAVIGPKINRPGDHYDPVNGVTIFSLTHVDTAIAPGIYYYDIQQVTDGTVVTTFYVGEFEVIGEVTTAIS